RDLEVAEASACTCRMRRALPLLLAACSSGAPLLPDAGPGDAGSTVDAGEPEIVRAHNAVRARAMPVPMPALPPLTWNQAAADFAAAWVDGCNFSHNPGLGSRYGENIYASTRMGTTPTAVVEDW